MRDHGTVGRLAIALWLALLASCGEGSPKAPPTLARRGTATNPRAVLRRVERDAGAEAPDGPRITGFLGRDETSFLASLRSEDVAHVELGRGGRSLAFRVTLADGRRAYFKPEQSFSAARWYSEVAAYHLDRELGFGRTPPVVSRRFYWPPLRRVAGDDARLAEVRVENHSVRGALIGWIEGRVPPLGLGRSWERWIRLEGPLAISPYQRPSDYRGLLNQRLTPEETEIGRLEEQDRPLTDARAGELSDLIVFDYLISNVDRWGGGFTNLRTCGGGGPLVFLDNGAGFWTGSHRLGLMDARLEALQRFRRRTIEALERFELAAFSERLAADPNSPLLTERQIEGVEVRRRAVLAHVMRLRRRFGDRIWVQE